MSASRMNPGHDGLMEDKDKDEKLSRLTAREFFAEWAKNEQVDIFALHTAEWLEFAEAYAQERVREFAIALNDKEVLLRRAAELLRIAEPALNLNMLETHITKRDTWYDDRHQWLRDAGMEK